MKKRGGKKGGTAKTLYKKKKGGKRRISFLHLPIPSLGRGKEKKRKNMRKRRKNPRSPPISARGEKKKIRRPHFSPQVWVDLLPGGRSSSNSLQKG